MKRTFHRRLHSSLLPCVLIAALACGQLQDAGATPEGFAGLHDDSGTKLNDDKVRSECQMAMAHYNFHTQVVSLNIMDTPLGYTPPRGPDMHFTVTYNQRELPSSNLPLPNFGSKWVCNWIAYADDVSFAQTDVTVHIPGGGSEFFSFINGRTTALQSGAIMTRELDQNGNITFYERHLPDGSREVYDRSTNTGGPRRFYMTKLIDPTGQEAHFNYDPVSFRLICVTDALGQSFLIDYWSDTSNDPPDYYLIKSVKDFALRTARFDYNLDGKLWKIHDAIGITSEFLYNENDEYQDDFITTMITPYGATHFSQPPSLPAEQGARTLQAVFEPDGGIERLEYQQGEATGIAASDPNLPEGTGSDVHWANGSFHARNSFYWDKKAMAMYPPDANGIPNFSKAKITHWLHVVCAENVVSNIKEREKWPLENPIYYRYPGQGGCGVGAGASAFTGTQGMPSIVAQRLDNGTGPHVTRLYRYEYDNPFQKITKATDAEGRVTSSQYASNNIDLIAVFQRNLSEGQSVDPGNLSADKIYGCTYIGLHQPRIVTDAAGQTTTYSYTPSTQLESVENARHEITTCEYGDGSTEDKPLGYLTKITSPLANGSYATTSFTYDDSHRVHEVTVTPDNYKVTTDYDDLDRPTQITYPDDTTEQFQYTDSVRGMTLDLTASKDRLNRWTYRHYNANRQMESITDPLTRTTNFGWCTCGSLESITDPKGQMTTFHRDLQGRVFQKVFDDSSTINYLFEGQSAPNTVGTTSRLTSATDALGRRTNYSYFKNGNIDQVSYTNTSGAPLTPHTPSVNYTYDENYNRIKTMNDGTGLTTYVYYPVPLSASVNAGRLQTIDGPLNNDVIGFEYDELGRVHSQSINSVAETVDYDSLGRLTTTDNALGHFSRGYDTVTPRLQTLTSPNGVTANCTYFGNTEDRRLQTLENLSGAETFPLSKFDYTYDDEGEITSWNRELANKTSGRWFEYDEARQLLSARNQFSANAATQVNGYAYDFAGNRTGDSFFNPLGPAGNGTFHSYEPNNLNQIESFTTQEGGISGPPVEPIHDLAGNLTNDGEGKTFEWDAANRLIAINHAGGQRTEFAYDGLGRRVKITEYGPGVTATIQPSGSEYTRYSAAPFGFPSGNYSLLFEGLNNSGGNMVLIDGVRLTNTLVTNGSFESPDVSSEPGSYQYNPIDATWSYVGDAGLAYNGSDLTSTNPDAPDGRQVAFLQNGGYMFQIRTVAAGTYSLNFYAAQRDGNTMDQQVRVNLRPSGAGVSIKRFVWCGNRICEERDNSGATVTKRFFADGEERIGGSDAGNYYYSRDHLGSIREVTDASGRLKARYDYDPYGKSVVVDGNMNVDFGYTGHYFHAPSGLNLTLYRAYNPPVGRWISRDSIGEVGGLNLYGYVENDPLNYWDPTGENPVAGALIGLGLGGPVGAVIGAGIGTGIVLIGGAAVIDWWRNRDPQYNQEASDAVDGGGKGCPADELSPTGQTQTRPSTRRGNEGGVEVQDGYVDSQGRPVTRQTVYSPTGRVVHGPHFRPGGFK